MVNKPLIWPYFWGGGTWPGGGWLTSHNIITLGRLYGFGVDGIYLWLYALVLIIFILTLITLMLIVHMILMVILLMSIILVCYICVDCTYGDCPCVGVKRLLVSLMLTYGLLTVIISYTPPKTAPALTSDGFPSSESPAILESPIFDECKMLTLEVQPPFFIGWFLNHHYFSRGLSSSKRNHHF